MSIDAQVLALAATHTQAQIADATGISRSRVSSILLNAGVRTTSPRGRKRSERGTAVCPSCDKEFTLNRHQKTHASRGQRPCCSRECLHKRQSDWAKSYVGYKRGPEANRWKHGMYSKESREASILIAAINRYVATINKHVKEGASI